jgi:hypothetical protein
LQSGSFATFAAIRLGSSLLSSLVAEASPRLFLIINAGKLLPAVP